MKKAIIKTGVITLGINIIFMMGFSQAPALTNKNEVIEFRLMEKFDNGPLFQLNMNNTEAAEFLIKIKNGEGSVLYSEKVNGKNIFRKYLVVLESEDLYDAFYVRFEITSKKTNEKFVYNVTNKTLVVSDIIVAKL